MQKCPKCGKDMRISGHVVGDPSRPAYNCDNCKIDCWVPPKPKELEAPPVEKPSEEETKTENEGTSADSGSTDEPKSSEEPNVKKTSSKKKRKRPY